MNDSTALTRRYSGYKIFLTILYLLSIIVYSCLAYKGSRYYLLPYDARPHSEMYTTYKPGGLAGHGYGIIGSAMMIIMLLYSLRKRLKFMQRVGPITHWLDLHIYLGIFGPLLIILHSTFKVQGIIAISFYSMLAIALSGVFGRFLYVQIPRNVNGHELSLAEMNELDAEFARRLRQKYNFTDEMIQQISEIATAHSSRRKWLIFFFIGMAFDNIRRAMAMRRFVREYKRTHKIPRKAVKALSRLARQKAALRQRIETLRKVQQLFHYWHVLHKPFAIIMILIMLVHVAITVSFGYKWVF